MADLLVVGSKVKEVAKKEGLATGSDVAEALSKIVDRVIREGAKRAKSNGRKTLRGSDV